jgi:hypothetical protein
MNSFSSSVLSCSWTCPNCQNLQDPEFVFCYFCGSEPDYSSTSKYEEKIDMAQNKVKIDFVSKNKCAVVAFMKGCQNLRIKLGVDVTDCSPKEVNNFLNHLNDLGFLEFEDYSHCFDTKADLIKGNQISYVFFDHLGKVFNISILMENKENGYFQKFGSKSINSKGTFTIKWESLNCGGGHWSFVSIG